MNPQFCKKGIYPLKNPSKYKGTTPIIYRSYPEFRLMSFFDTRPFVLEWTSESVVVPYIRPDDGRVHRYYIDFSCKFLNTDKTITKYLIEYKPFRQTQQPTPRNNKKEKTYLMECLTYAINQSKWKSAEQYAKKNNMKFMIITEKELPPL